MGVPWYTNTISHPLGGNDYGTKEVKLSDAKMYLISLQRSGLGYSSIHNIRGVIRPAFQMAVDDDMILKKKYAKNLIHLPRHYT